MKLIIPLKGLVKNDLKVPLIDWLDAPPDYEEFANPLLATNTMKPSFSSIDCLSDLTRLASLRNCLADAIPKASAHRHALDNQALSDSHEYYAALLACQSQGFPLLDEGSPLTLTWKAAVGPQQETHGSLLWDQVGTLWNIAALESFMGATHSSNTTTDRKQIVKHYQSAASTICYLRETVLPGPIALETVDMSDALLHFWERAMLACAQIATYDMLLHPTDEPPKQALLSYIAMGAVPVLNEALVASQNPLLVSHLPTPILEWGTTCKYWSMLLTAKAEYHQAVLARQTKDWGMELGRLQQSMQLFQSCQVFCDLSNMDNPKAEVERWLALVKDQKEQANKDHHEYMYGDANVMSPDTLPPIRPQLVVKSTIPMPESMMIPKVQLFAFIR